MKLRNIVASTFLILLSPIISTADNSFDTRKTFVEDLASLQIGFTKEQVEKIMGNYLKGTNWKLFGSNITIPGTKRVNFEVDTSKTDQLTLKNCDVYRHSNDGAYDSDWGIVCYQNDIVEYIDYAQD